MKQLPTAAEVRKVALATIQTTCCDGVAVLPTEVRDTLLQFAEMLEERERMARVFEENRQYYAEKMGNELQPIPQVEE